MQVIFQDGHPFRWLFTSKRGEIMRKRQIDVAQIISRMGRASDKCVIRYLPNETAQVKTNAHGFDCDAFRATPAFSPSDLGCDYSGGVYAEDTTNISLLRIYVCVCRTWRASSSKLFSKNRPPLFLQSRYFSLLSPKIFPYKSCPSTLLAWS